MCESNPMLTFDSSILYATFDIPLTLAVIAGVGVLYLFYAMLRPLLESGEVSAEEWARMEDESMTLLARRDRAVAELRDLEFEVAMNKVGDQDYQQLWQKYEGEALLLIQQLEGEAS